MSATNTIQLVSSTYFAQRISVCSKTISRWEKANQFPQHRLIGNKALWYRHDIDDWFNNVWTPEREVA